MSSGGPAKWRCRFDNVTKVIKVDIWSDIACPWCFVGKRRFESGVVAFNETNPGEKVDVEFHSFELSPDTPVDFDGNSVDFMVQYKGIPADQARGMMAQMVETAAEVGLKYDLDALQQTRTIKAHRLLHFAKQRNRQVELKERLMAAYFEEGCHLGRDENLADLAAEVGLDRQEALRSLEAGEYDSEVKADQAKAVELGIGAVPFFVVEGKYGISGAQSPETFVNVLEEILADRGPDVPLQTTGEPSAGGCADGSCEVPDN